jgi:hypothetical protein
MKPIDNLNISSESLLKVLIPSQYSLELFMGMQICFFNSFLVLIVAHVNKIAKGWKGSSTA